MISKIYRPQLFSIDHPLDDTKKKRGPFESMLFSMMCANDLKKQHELLNGFRYDIVVRYRFDLLFHGVANFQASHLKERTVYSQGINNGHVPVDYQHHGINDMFFYGDSESMDIVSDIYKVYSTTLHDIRRDIITQKPIDPQESMLSFGQLIYRLAAQRNIRCTDINGELSTHIPVLWRNHVKHLDPVDDYDMICAAYRKQK
jgi:hypothetical protein